jgi:hypothetical protein
MNTIQNSTQQTISTKGGCVELGLVLDRSTSMETVQDSACAAFNLLLAEQHKLTAPARATFLLFNESHELLISGRPLAEVPNLSHQNYRPSGSTALLDAMGTMIETIGARLDPEPVNSSKVLIVTLTDGAENTSRKYNFNTLKEVISYRQGICGWQFILISPKPATIAFRLGIPITNALPWTSSPEAVAQTLGRLSKSITSYRLGDNKWRAQLK